MNAIQRLEHCYAGLRGRERLLLAALVAIALVTACGGSEQKQPEGTNTGADPLFEIGNSGEEVGADPTNTPDPASGTQVGNSDQLSDKLGPNSRITDYGELGVVLKLSELVDNEVEVGSDIRMYASVKNATDTFPVSPHQLTIEVKFQAFGTVSTFNTFEMVVLPDGIAHMSDGLATLEPGKGAGIVFGVRCDKKGIGSVSVTATTNSSESGPVNIRAESTINCVEPPTPTPVPTSSSSGGRPTVTPSPTPSSFGMIAYRINGQRYAVWLFGSSGPPRSDGCLPGYLTVGTTDYRTASGGAWMEADNAIISFDDPTGPELEMMPNCGFGHIGEEAVRDDFTITRDDLEIFCDAFFKRTLPEGADPSLASSNLVRGCLSWLGS